MTDRVLLEILHSHLARIERLEEQVETLQNNFKQAIKLAEMAKRNQEGMDDLAATLRGMVEDSGESWKYGIQGDDSDV